MKVTADSIGKFGVTKPITCPKCEKEVSMQVLRSNLGVGAFGVSVYNYKHDLFTICPECQGLFNVNEDVAKVEAKAEFGLGEHVANVKPEDLTFVMELK